NVTEFTVGQRVYPYPLYAKGDTRKAGIIGGFSEFILIPNAKLNHSLYFVPEQISDKTASLIEPFTVGCRAARRSLPKKGENAIVFGCGTIGLAAAIALKWFGCEKVMICDLSEFRLNIAKELGFEICSISGQDFYERSVGYFGGAYGLSGTAPDADIFIDAAGHESVLDLYMKHGKIESRFVSVAVNNAIRNLDLLHLTYAQKSIIGSGGYMPEDVRDVLAIMESGIWDIEKIITHEYPHSELEKAIRKASETNEALNVSIYFNEGN
ncbi:MAG: zinc-binding dehydrogenase, partial [Ruminiclostridium sp.]